MVRRSQTGRAYVPRNLCVVAKAGRAVALRWGQQDSALECLAEETEPLPINQQLPEKVSTNYQMLVNEE